MNHSFPRLLTLLRKEKKISQKDAAKDLGISQALLSHYENGIRECGLDFLVRAAEYYQVSCDYLLGRTASRSGALLHQQDDNSEAEGKEKSFIRVIKLVFDLLKKFNCSDLADCVLLYLKTALYQVFRLMYSANTKNSQNLFRISKHFYRNHGGAALLLLENKIDLLARGKHVPDMVSAEKGEAPAFSVDQLERADRPLADALQTLIRDVEDQSLL